MKGINSRIHSILLWEYFPFFVFALLMLILHFFMRSYGDDLVYGEVFYKEPVMTFIINSYNGWSSRILIMPVASFFTGNNFMLFAIFDTIVYFILPLMISKIFLERNSQENNWIIVCLLTCVPFVSMLSTAGWVVTSIHYLWPVSFGLVALYPIKKVNNQESMQWYEYFIYFFATIFAINMEIMAAVIMTFYVIFCIYFIYKKKNTWVILALAILSIGNLVFILICPGNQVREIAETMTRFPEYANFNLIQKMSLSATSSLVCIDQNFILLAVLGMAWLFTWEKSEVKHSRVVGILPFLCALIINVTRVIILSPKFAYLFGIVTGSELVNWIDPKKIMVGIPNELHYIILGFMLFFAGTLMLMTYDLFKNTDKLYVAILIMGAGIMSRIVMAFSATVYVSGARTFLFVYIALVIFGFIEYQQFKPRLSKMKQNMLMYSLFILSVLGYMESFLKII